MIDPSNMPDAIELTPEMKTFLNETRSNLQGSKRRNLWPMSFVSWKKVVKKRQNEN